MKKIARTLKSPLTTAAVICSIAAQISFSAQAKDRNKTLADVMHETMQTKDLAYLLQTRGKPDSVVDLGTLQHLEWSEQSGLKRNIVRDDICGQMYTVDRSGKIVGWDTTCDMTTGKSKYGKILESTPIPNPVIPKEVADYFKKRVTDLRAEWAADDARRDAQKAKEEAEIVRLASGRRLTFPEMLMALVGKSEEEIVIQNSDALISNEKLDNGKTIRGYRLEYSEDRYIEGYYENIRHQVTVNCKYRLIFLQGKMIGYNSGDCPIEYPKNDARRAPKNKPATAPKAYP